MIDNSGEAQLKVPKDIAKKLGEKAAKKGISGRAPWAIYARLVLREAVEEGSA